MKIAIRDSILMSDGGAAMLTMAMSNVMKIFLEKTRAFVTPRDKRTATATCQQPAIVKSFRINGK